MKSILIALVLFLIAFVASAQDTLYKRSKETLVVKIVELGLDDVKYRDWIQSDGPLMTIPKDRLWKIVFSTGVTQLITPDMTDPENYAGQKRNAIKMDFLSPLRDNLSFFYERSLRPGRSIESNLGIIGVGFKVGDRKDEKASGAFLRFGYKFMKLPDFYQRGVRYTHLLHGAYVRPEVIFGSYSVKRIENYWSDWSNYSQYMDHKVVFGAIQLSLGKQWIYDDTFLIDVFGGLGYAISDRSGTPTMSDKGIDYGISGGSSSSPFSATGGVRIGFLFK